MPNSKLPNPLALDSIAADASMILFHSIIKIAIRSVDDFAPQYPVYGTRVGYVTIGSHALWSWPATSLACFEELLAATISRLFESIESTRLPSLSTLCRGNTTCLQP